MARPDIVAPPSAQHTAAERRARIHTLRSKNGRAPAEAAELLELLTDEVLGPEPTTT